MRLARHGGVLELVIPRSLAVGIPLKHKEWKKVESRRAAPACNTLSHSVPGEISEALLDEDVDGRIIVEAARGLEES